MAKASLGPGIDIDVPQLIKSRLLVQANSGGGKSFTLRRLCEQTYGMCQHIIIDPEGEFYTLREKFDYVLLGKGGEGPADLKSATLLARRLLELGVSAIIDISELGIQQARFVKLFLEALVDAPRALWHPVLVVVDEAHKYCPEKGRGESESTAAVIDLMTRGRKRGFCGVLSTQRVSKLNKDAAAECVNKLIGRCTLDVDRKRAAEELGIEGKEEVRALRDLEAGEFFVYGPALCKTITKVKIGAVQTTHPEAGEVAPPVSPPRAKIKQVMAELANLPHEAEEEAKNVAELQQEVRQLKGELRKAESAKPSSKVETVKELTPLIDQRTLARVLKHAEKMDIFRDKLAQSQQVVVSETGNLVSFMAQQLKKIEASVVDTLPPQLRANAVQMQHRPRIGVLKHSPMRKEHAAVVSTATASYTLDKPQRRILDALAWFEAIGIGAPQGTALAFMSGYSGEDNGAYKNNRSRLRVAGLVTYPSEGTVQLTGEGRALAQTPAIDPTGEGLRAAVFVKLDEPMRRVLRPVVEAYPNDIEGNDLAVTAGYSDATNGAYKNNRSRLRTLGLVTYPRDGAVRAADILFPD